MADENRMITFEYAASTWDQYKKQTVPSTKECMTKSEIITYFNVDSTPLNSLGSNQLVRRDKFIGKNNTISPVQHAVLESALMSTTDYWKPTYNEAINYSYNFSSVGIIFLVNNGNGTDETIVNYYLDDTNKHIPRKLEISFNSGFSETLVPTNFSKTDNTFNGRGGRFLDGTNELNGTLVIDLPNPIPNNYRIGNFIPSLFYVAGSTAQTLLNRLTFQTTLRDANNNIIQTVDKNIQSSGVNWIEKKYRIYRFPDG